MTAVRAVLFDFGHTLVDFARTEDALREAYTVVRDRLTGWVEDRAPPEVDELVERIAGAVDDMVGRSYIERRLEELDQVALFEEAFAAIGYELPRELLHEVAEIDHDSFSRSLVAPPETIATLERLRGMGIRLGLISNVSLLPGKIRADVDALGIGRLMDAAAFSSEVGVRKPDARIFTHTLRALDVDPAHAVFVGDRVNDDVVGARGVGMRTILTRQFRQEDPGDVRPDATVERLEEVPGVIAGWGSASGDDRDEEAEE
jgi:putative hydrolase of the HAD superfamily